MNYRRIASAVLCASSVAVLAAGSCSDSTGPTDVKLIVVERSATTLKLQWDQIGSASYYTVDYLTGIPSCTSPLPTHNNGLVVASTSATVTGLLPSTAYHVHVHALLGAGPLVDPDLPVSKSVYVTTLAAGSGPQAVTASDYVTC